MTTTFKPTLSVPSAIWKICPRALWETALAVGRFEGAPVDLTDGYIHFSTAAQLAETARRHFCGQSDLVLLGIDTERLARLGPDALRWEASRGGDLFPHLYASLPVEAVIHVAALPLDAGGTPVIPVLDVLPDLPFDRTVGA